MDYEAIHEGNLKYYEDLIPGPLRHFAHFPGEIMLGAFSQNEDKTADPAGIMMLNAADPKTLSIDWLFVDPEFREQEAATDLLSGAFEMAGRAEFEAITVRAADERAESFLIRRGFSPRGEVSDWFLELKDLSLVEWKNSGEDQLIASLKELSRDVVSAELDRAVTEESCFPVIPSAIDPDHSFICAEGKGVGGSLFIEKVDGVYCLAALRGSEAVKEALIGRALESFRNIKEEGYFHVRSISEGGNTLGGSFFQKMEPMKSVLLVAEADSMEAAAESQNKMMELEKAAEAFDEDIPEKLVVEEVEYYSGMKIGSDR